MSKSSADKCSEDWFKSDQSHQLRTDLINFGLWLLKRGNRENTIERKLRYLKGLSGSPDEMVQQIFNKGWCDLSKSKAIDAVYQYSQFIGKPIVKPRFRVYQNSEMYVPTPSMIKQFVYRVRNIPLRAIILTAIETGASRHEVWQLTWNDVNLATKTVTITGIKGHRTATYPISDELITLLMQIPRTSERIFPQKTSRHLNDRIIDYRQHLSKETGNQDFNKLHFHSLRHFSISMKYFRTKDIVETQRFARHCNINNTMRYVHIIKGWIKENEFDVVYATTQQELTKYLSEGFELTTKTEWGYCLKKPKSLIN